MAFFPLSFLMVYAARLRTAKALARLRLCAGSPEPLLVANVISIIFSYDGSYVALQCVIRFKDKMAEKITISIINIRLKCLSKQGKPGSDVAELNTFLDDQWNFKS